MSCKKSIAPLLIVLSLSAAGCKSGWKMPGASMWSWSRQPSAETLAGSTPRPTIETPATKHTPSALASAAAGNKVAGTPTNPGAGSTTGYPTGASAAGGIDKPAYGAAAAANGYQTGPYGMSGLAASTGNSTASAPTNATASTGYPGGNYLPNSVYNGSAGLPGSSVAAPATVTPSPGSYANTANPYANMTPPPGSQYAPPVTMASTTLPSTTAQGSGAVQSAAGNSYSMPVATPPAGSTMPSYQPGLGHSAAGHTGAATTQPGLPASTIGFPSAMPTSSAVPGSSAMPGNVPMPTGNSGSYPTPSVPLPGGVGSLPGAATSGATLGSLPSSSYTGASSSMPTASAAMSSDGYRPGTTARSTNYNFGVGAGTAPTSAAGATQYPAQSNVPLPTAGGAASGGYGSFQLPPNTASTPTPTYR